MSGILLADPFAVDFVPGDSIRAGLASNHSIYVGVVAEEPIRLLGLSCVFEEHAGKGTAQLIPVKGTLEEVLASPTLEHLLLDLNSSSSGLATLEAIRRVRPTMRMIVIGPEQNEEMVMNTIIAGARAYLAASAGPAVVRKAIEVVASGSIWAPRALLSKLIDRLLPGSEQALTNGLPRLTVRESQVLDLILTANSNREIARRLGIEERTVKAHVGRLMRKTGVDNRVELSVRALNGWSSADVEIPERRVGERRLTASRSSQAPSSLLTT